MKRIFISTSVVFLFLFLLLIASCKKEDNTLLTNTNTTVPNLYTNEISNITTISAICGGDIQYDGGTPILSKGICWGQHEYPTIDDNIVVSGSGNEDFTNTLKSLKPYTTYYVCAYATNAKGTSYGSPRKFRTLPTGELVTDIDGNIYGTVKIGTQTWMLGDLKVTHFRDGTPILEEKGGADSWANNLTPTYRYMSLYYEDDGYGALYNQFAINDVRNICPSGWHIPSRGEWIVLINYLGGEGMAGAKLKEIGEANWNYPNTAANNESGFTALPGGYIDGNGQWTKYHDIGKWWSSSVDGHYTSCLSLFNNKSSASLFEERTWAPFDNPGFFVRCIKD